MKPEDYCNWRQTMKGLEVFEDGVRTFHVEHVYRDCIGPKNHTPGHIYGPFVDAVTGEAFDLNEALRMRTTEAKP